MISEEEKKKLMEDFVYVRIGAVMQVWMATASNLEILICSSMGKEHCSPGSKAMLDIMDWSDTKKIKEFRTEFLDKKNRKFHDLLNIDNAVNILITGLKSRNYFAHSTFNIDESGNVIVRTNKRSKEEAEKAAAENNFLPVTNDVLNNERQNVCNAFNLLDDFISKLSKASD